ncbi:MAG TPA: hypothetical protein VJ553_05405 [Candidatus Paceibacterota bacterium]|nr:hypothetical protein [Candidatus Paceibacterota bacterium]
MAIKAAPYKQCPERSDYMISVPSGALTIVAANGPLWSMQWTSTSLICVVKRVKLSLGVTTAFTTAQTVHLGLYFARAYTVADTGGTAATLTTNNGKLDTSYPTTVLTDLRMCTTGALTPGTRTLDAQSLDVGVFACSAIGAAGDVEMQFGLTPSRQEIILRQNEGLVLHNLTTMGVVGVVRLTVTLEWAEVPSSSVK